MWIPTLISRNSEEVSRSKTFPFLGLPLARKWASVLVSRALKSGKSSRDSPRLVSETHNKGVDAREKQVTAGAAAAAAQQGIDFNNATDEDLDIYLLTELINQGKDPPEWSAFNMLQNPQERWNDLFNEWQMDEAITPDELAPMTLFQVAHSILQRKQQNGDAKLAAATVEAVDLPTVALTETREV